MVSTLSFAVIFAGFITFLHAAHVAPLMTDDEMFALDPESLEEQATEKLAYIAVKAGASRVHTPVADSKERVVDFDNFATYANQKLSERRKSTPDKVPATENQIDEKVHDEMRALFEESNEGSTRTHVWLFSGGVMLLTFFIVIMRFGFSGKKVAN